MCRNQYHAATAIACLVAISSCVPAAQGQADQAPATLPAPTLTPTKAALTIDTAIVWALEHNPEIAAVRLRHGIAAAGVVIARTYPFNPVFETEVRHNGGPASAGITNRVTPTFLILLELELRHQGLYRRQGACATLSRTDWEIAYQELLLAGRVMGAFNTVL